MAIYAVSDLHGHYDEFMAGLNKIELGDDDFLYVLGDAIDRGDDGIKILQYIMAHDNMDLLIGNHELMMLNSVYSDGEARCGEEDSDLWLYGNGGTKTFAQYKKLSAEKRKALLEWLNNRYVIKSLKIGEKEFCLTHSYYIEDCENKRFCEIEYQDVWDIVWMSLFRDSWRTHGTDIYRDYDYTFITGHVPVFRVMQRFERRDSFNELRIYQRHNLIDIDGGCAAGYQEGLNNGVLFLRLDDMEVFPIPMIEKH